MLRKRRDNRYPTMQALLEDAGFVDILHVGRDEGGDFFYYVMELADEDNRRTLTTSPPRATSS